jgi:hypothetical protein
MNLGELSVRKNRVVFVLMFLVFLGGLVAYHKLGRLEDPEFTIKEALIITPYPGPVPRRSPERSPTRLKPPVNNWANSSASSRNPHADAR